jgi:hypothetical protein
VVEPEERQIAGSGRVLDLVAGVLCGSAGAI